MRTAPILLLATLGMLASACGWLAFEPVGVLPVEAPDAGTAADAGNSCSDGKRTGDETDRDCGGPACAACALGQHCWEARDCESGRCEGGLCLAPDGCKPTPDETVCSERGAKCGTVEITECDTTRTVTCEDTCKSDEACGEDLTCVPCDLAAERARLCAGHCGTVLVCGRTMVQCNPPGMSLVRNERYKMGEGATLHDVRLSHYCIDVEEVSVGDYLRCVEAGTCTKPTTINDPKSTSQASARSTYCTLRDTTTQGRLNAVNCVDWNDAKAYCAFVGKQLPTEAQWEGAARLDQAQYVYPWGSTPPTKDLVNACGKDDCIGPLGGLFGALGLGTSPMYQGNDGAQAVTETSAYPGGTAMTGAMQLSGNVGEWVHDWFAPYGTGEALNPVGPSTGTERVWRGGSWRDTDPNAIKVTTRYSAAPSARLETVGFRCARMADIE